MMETRAPRIFIYLSTFASLTANAVSVRYTVRPGDILSKIVAARVGRPVYGKRGNLQKILVLNPNIRNPNHIYPGQVLIFGENFSEQVKTDSELSFARSERVPASEGVKMQPVLEFVENPTSDEFSRFELEGIFGQSRIDTEDPATGGKSVAGSSFSPAVRASWEQHWDGGFRSFLRARLGREDFKTTSATQSFSDHTPTEFGFEFGARVLSLGERANLWASLGYDGEPFVSARSATELSVGVVSIPRASLLMDFDLYRSRVFRLAAELGGAYLAPASSDGFSAKSGFGWEAGLKLVHARPKNSLFGGLRIAGERQNTTISNHAFLSAGIFFGITFDVGGEP